MVTPGKWFKSLLSLKKHDRSASDRDGNSANRERRSQRGQTLEIESSTSADELNFSGEIKDGENGDVSTSESTFPPSFIACNAAETRGSLTEELAVRKIQAAFKKLLVSRRNCEIYAQNEHSVEIEGRILQKGEDLKDATLEQACESCHSPSTINQNPHSTGSDDHHVSENDLNQNTTAEAEETKISQPNAARASPSRDQAAIKIQRAFRQHLARRAMHALKGLVRLQSLVRGRCVRKQAADTLNRMQSLVRVQACVQARRARKASESQCAQQQNHPRQHEQEEEAHVKETEGGWCDSVGSAEQIQANLLKRKEAAAKREKARAYSLARQWQARPREPTVPLPPGFQPGKGDWNWNWLERWIAFRPWENRFINAERDDTDGKQTTKAVNNGTVSPRLSSPAEGGGCNSNSSSKKSQGGGGSRKLVVSSKSSKSVLKQESGGTISRSQSTPKERISRNDRDRPSHTDKPGNKRLSLPGNDVMHGARLARQQTAARPAVCKSGFAPRPKPS